MLRVADTQWSQESQDQLDNQRNFETIQLHVARVQDKVTSLNGHYQNAYKIYKLFYNCRNWEIYLKSFDFLFQF